MKEFIEILKAFILGIIEGITEWLPISSTGHMIIFDELWPMNVSEEFRSLFLVVIQLGAIVAVPVIFFDKLWPFSKKRSKEENKRTLSLWGKVIVGAIPAAVIGFILDDLIDGYLMGGSVGTAVVASALIVYGIGFIIVERLRKDKPARITDVHDIGYKDALVIGSFQVLSLIPGTSRSGSTILGGLIWGVSRTAASEFSFFMAIPIMLGASLLKIVKYFLIDGLTIGMLELGMLTVGLTVSFLVSVVAIRFLMNFVKSHTFSAFGIYRILLGAVLIGYLLLSTFVI